MSKGRFSKRAGLLFAGLWWAASAGSGVGHPDPVVRGRIEIVRPEGQRNRTDAGGVAVWLLPVDGATAPGVSGVPKVRLIQKDKRFVPHVMVIQVGTEVEFPNDDPFFHNVFSLFDGKIFDLGLYANGETRPVRFNRPGVSYIYCNIHPQMSAVIVAVETPYFCVSRADGTFSIADVPPGSYRLRLWHERSDAQQLAAKSRIVGVAEPVVDLGTIRLDESNYIPRTHKNKYGEEYDETRRAPGYPPP